MTPQTLLVGMQAWQGLCSAGQLTLGACRTESPEEVELREKIEGLKLRVQEGEAETVIEVPALSGSTSSPQPNGHASSAAPAEGVSGQEAVDLAKQTVEQASEGSSDQPIAASKADGDEPKPVTAAASKAVSAWAKKPSLQLQTTVQEYLQDCQGKLKQLSARLDAEARPAAAAPSTASAAPTSKAPSRW